MLRCRNLYRIKINDFTIRYCFCKMLIFNIKK